MAGIVGRRGGDVIGGMALHRKKLREGASELVDRLLGALEAEPSTPA
jgi:hypothetical protein